MVAQIKVSNKINKGIHIIGSCCSRDIFRILEEDRLVGKYTARSSLISRVSPPLKFNLNSQINSLESNWQQRMLKQDFEKNGLHIEDYAKGVLIIDFIDERLLLLKVGDTFITQSTEFTKCKLNEVLNIDKEVRRGRQEEFDLWIDACHKFTKLIPENIRKKTILHKAFWASKYRKNGELYDFEDRDKIIFFNKNLDFYYKTFESIYSPGCIVEVSLEKSIADAQHLWGLSPFHYTEEYYQECYKQIIAFSKLNII